MSDDPAHLTLGQLRALHAQVIAWCGGPCRRGTALVLKRVPARFDAEPVQELVDRNAFRCSTCRTAADMVTASGWTTARGITDFGTWKKQDARAPEA